MITHHIAVSYNILPLQSDNEITCYCKMFLQIILSAQQLYAIKILCNKKASTWPKIYSSCPVTWYTCRVSVPGGAIPFWIMCFVRKLLQSIFA